MNCWGCMGTTKMTKEILKSYVDVKSIPFIPKDKFESEDVVLHVIVKATNKEHTLNGRYIYKYHEKGFSPLVVPREREEKERYSLLGEYEIVGWEYYTLKNETPEEGWLSTELFPSSKEANDKFDVKIEIFEKNEDGSYKNRFAEVEGSFVYECGESFWYATNEDKLTKEEEEPNADGFYRILEWRRKE